MRHDVACELTPGRMTCACASRAYAADPFVDNGGLVVVDPLAPLVVAA